LDLGWHDAAEPTQQIDPCRHCGVEDLRDRPDSLAVDGISEEGLRLAAQQVDDGAVHIAPLLGREVLQRRSEVRRLAHQLPDEAEDRDRVRPLAEQQADVLAPGQCGGGGEKPAHRDEGNHRLAVREPRKVDACGLG
jgi:hypothetical protein